MAALNCIRNLASHNEGPVSIHAHRKDKAMEHVQLRPSIEVLSHQVVEETCAEKTFNVGTYGSYMRVQCIYT